MIKITIQRNVILSILLLIFTLLSSLNSEGNQITQEQSEAILDKIYEKYIPIYTKYIGVKSTRKVDIKEFDPKTNRFISRSKVLLICNDYFYKKAEKQVLSFIKNDKKMKPSDHKSKETKPGYPVFDINGRKNYKTRITGYKTIAKKNCYHIKVIPKKKTVRHFKGSVYCRTDDLRITLVEGTLADLPFPLEEFKMKLIIGHIKDLPVLNSATFIIRVYIPILMPDRRYISSIKASENIPIFK